MTARGAAAAAQLSSHNPFKGQASFETEDETMFFGRDQEAADLTHQILSSRMTVLHAPSGAGKTSLLNARIIPNIEREGWLAVRARPEHHPSEALKAAVLQYLLPPPRAELQAIARAMTVLDCADTAPFASIFEKSRELRQAEPGSVRVQSLFAPVRAKDTPEGSYAVDAPTVPMLRTFSVVRPLVSRVLSDTLDVSTALAQWAFVADSSTPRRADEFAGASPTIGGVREALARETMREGYARLLAALTPPLPGLLTFFRNLSPWCRAMRPGTQLVLILDQFEEIFVRFADPGYLAADVRRAVGDASQTQSASPLADWRLRREFFSELEALHRAAHQAVRANRRPGSPGGWLGPLQPPSKSRAAAAPEVMPIRFVISLRDEYVARLTRVRRFAPEVTQSTYRLEFLSLDQAAAAVVGPVERRGRSIERACVDSIVHALQLEEAFVEPGPLQIVSHYLWDYRPTEREITVNMLTHGLGGVSGILGRYLGDFVLRLIDRLQKEGQESDVRQVWPREYVELETLSLLDLLLTPSGTRNVVEQRFLAYVPMRDPGRRQRLLGALEHERIVRRESRLYGDFYEITHEFLTEPIRKALKSSAAYESLERALAELDDTRQEPHRLLTKESFAALHRHETMFVWDPPATEIMLRSAIAHHDEGVRGESLQFWVRKIAQSCAPGEINLKGSAIPPYVLRALGADVRKLSTLGSRERAAVLRSLIRANLTIDEALLGRIVEGQRP